MRAERSRGSRIRSPSSRNELIEKEIRQKARHCRAFLFLAAILVRTLQWRNFSHPYFYWHYVGKRAYESHDHHDDIDAGYAFEIATAAVRACSIVLQGYPIPTIKKKRVCVVTYRHSGVPLFENSFPPRSNVNNL
jgi:hypothetical protein